MKPKVLYILPMYHRASFTNSTHLWELIQKAAEQLTLTVLIEQGESPTETSPVSKVALANSKFFLFRIIKRCVHLIHFGLKGGKVVYVHGSYLSLALAKVVMKLFGGKVLYWQCEKFEEYGQDIPTGKLGFLKWKILSDLPLKMTLKMTDYFVTGGQKVAERYSELFDVNPSRIRILPNSINLDRFEAKKRFTPSSHPHIVFVHWLSPRKGVYELPEIIHRILEEIPKAHFTIIGEGPLRKWLSEKIEKHKWKRQVYLSGKVDNKAIKSYLRKADLFIMPSRQEGFPRVLLEAMASGIPFVSTEVGCVSEMVDESQRVAIVERKNPESFADKTIQILKDVPLYKKLSTAGLKRVKQYEIKAVAEQFVSLITRIHP